MSMSAQVAIVWGAEDRAMPVIAPLCCQFEFAQDVLMSLCNISTARLCTRSKSSPLNVGVGFGSLNHSTKSPPSAIRSKQKYTASTADRQHDAPSNAKKH
jgi:hypothetical protein